MRRRAFLRCGAAAAALAAGRSAPGGQLHPAPRVQLLWEDRRPVLASQLVPHRTYVFAYPFEGTPCFLLHLGRPVAPRPIEARAGTAGYVWPGGTGRQQSVVAYSAICPHAYTHPTREVAMIHYYPPGAPAAIAPGGGVIGCCGHGSTFEPGQGAMPLQPPAEWPLATVVLAWEKEMDTLHAEGVIGRRVFADFFEAFPRSGRQAVQDATVVWELEGYTRAVLSC